MRRLNNIAVLTVILSVAVSIMGCGKKKDNRTRVSQATGQKFGEDTPFTVEKYQEQETGPGLVFIPGATMHLGNSEQDIGYDMDARPRQVTVSSFYMDECEVSNLDWKQFLYGLKDSIPAEDDKFKFYIPDTMVWYRELAFNDPYTKTYFQHPAYNLYPVVGITWLQAQDYCKWRTTIVNGKLAQDNPPTVTDPDAARYQRVVYPEYRLPIESEWEYAARGGLYNELYPWEGHTTRRPKRGEWRANFYHGRGDYAGWYSEAADWTPRNTDDVYTIPTDAKWGEPNNYGLYNMSGNVAEWVQDTYRILTYEDADDLNPHRRNDRVDGDNRYITSGEYFTAKAENLTNVSRANSATLIGEKTKVYRGGSWKDIAYYMTCGARRHEQDTARSATIGFRCAMTRVGSSRVNN